jgi:hypothetical protein
MPKKIVRKKVYKSTSRIGKLQERHGKKAVSKANKALGRHKAHIEIGGAGRGAANVKKHGIRGRNVDMQLAALKKRLASKRNAAKKKKKK